MSGFVARAGWFSRRADEKRCAPKNFSPEKKNEWVSVFVIV